MGTNCTCIRQKGDDTEILSVEESMIKERSFITKERDEKELDLMYPCANPLGRQTELEVGLFSFKTNQEKFIADAIVSSEGWKYIGEKDTQGFKSGRGVLPRDFDLALRLRWNINDGNDCGWAWPSCLSMR